MDSFHPLPVRVGRSLNFAARALVSVVSHSCNASGRCARTENVADADATPEGGLPDDAFEISVSLNMGSYFMVGPEHRIGGLTLTSWTTRQQLEEFRLALIKEHEDCRNNRKLSPSEEDYIWRLMY